MNNPTTTFTSAVALEIRVCGNGLEQSRYLPAYANNPAAPGGVPTPVALSVGANVLTPPPGAVSACLVPPAASANAKVVGSASGSAGGIPFQAGLVLVPVVAGTPIYVQSAAVETLMVAWF